MKKIILYSLSALLISLLMTGCGPAMVSKGSEFPKMYDEAPRSLLVMPPINESPDVEAKDYYLTTMEELFAQWGYYVFPTELTADIFKQQGVYDTELLYNSDVTKFREFFGADAVVFTKIKEWHVSYAVIASSLTVNIEMEIRSTKTNEQLWNYGQKVVVDLSGGGDGGGGVAGLLIKAIATAINTAAADYLDYAKQANARIVYALPAGPYHPSHMADQDIQIVDQTPNNPE